MSILESFQTIQVSGIRLQVSGIKNREGWYLMPETQKLNRSELRRASERATVDPVGFFEVLNEQIANVEVGRVVG